MPLPRLRAQIVHMGINADFMCPSALKRRRPPIFSHSIDVEIGMVQFIRNAIVVTKATDDFYPGTLRPTYNHFLKQNCAEDRMKAPSKFATWGLDWRTKAPANSTDHGRAGEPIRGRHQH